LTRFVQQSKQGDDSGTSTPTTTAPAAGGEDLDFSDIKKKKKSSKKKAAFDLEAFEKELNDSKSKSAGGEDDDEDIPEANPALDDDADLGDDDPFAQAGEAPAGAVDSGAEQWLKSDRDYFYPEVGSLIIKIMFSGIQ
jgi:translation initiation factor 2 subunit 2